MAIPEDIQEQLRAEVERMKGGEVSEITNDVDEEQETVIDEEVIDDNEDLEPDEEVDDEGADDEDPPGFLSYDEWVAEGKNPDDWRGKNAFKREYERIQKNREYEQKNKELDSRIDKLVSLFEEEKQQVAERTRAEERERYEREIAEAKENMDVDRLEELLKKKPEEKPAQQEFTEPEPIANYRRDNPIINPESDQFDPEFEAAVAGIVNTELKSIGAGVNDSIMQRVIDQAYNKVKSLYPEKFESPKNSRKTVSKTTTAKKQPRFKNVEFSEMGGHVKGSSLEMLKWFERTKGKDHPATIQFKKSMEA